MFIDYTFKAGGDSDISPSFIYILGVFLCGKIKQYN